MQQPKWDRIKPERFLALLTIGMAFVNLVSAVTPVTGRRLLLLEEILPMEVRQGTHLATALAGFGLLVLASGIWRGKRTAWLITLVTLAITIIAHLMKGIDIEEAGLSFALFFVFIVFNGRFQVRSDAPTVRRGLVTLGIAMLFTMLYGTIGFYLLDRHFSIHFNVWQAILQTARMFTEFVDPAQFAITRYGRYFAGSIYLVAIITIGYALLAMLAPVLLRQPAPLSERQRAAGIVRKYGRTVLARFCLFPDKQYFFSPSGSLVAYAYHSGAAVVLGDPIGPAEDALPTVRAFLELCHRNDWQPAFYQTGDSTLAMYHQAGLRALKIGEEALVDLSTFTLQGGAMKAVRTAVNKLERLSYTCRLSQPPHDEALLYQLESISLEWLAEGKRKEMRYSMGWFDRDYLNSTFILCVQDTNGQIIAFANLVDANQNEELAVDLMRHRTDTPPGTMDYLFANLLLDAQRRGYKRFNLGLSGLAHVGESSSDPAIERALHFIYNNVNLSYNFKGLHNFKEKFHPLWQPRYLIYPSLASLPLVATALNELNT